MLLHYHINKIINRRCLLLALSMGILGTTITVLVSNKHFAVQHLPVPQYVVQHLLIKVLWRILKRDFHAPGFLRFQVDVSGD